ncbi:D-alanyl-D-alanine carboxypeptidase family protein [Oricola sp.]|uniref:D-alanyl-D-alanine carboxypeptidase family protein n=1 Tax=Oricola sp. TaxID=1979950 RepID=UPI0025E083CE|nr:D-alanyl-D-alanine carboxypeptidase family protein [Oricola sp.]MCI5075200.1 D-alanyl-D-alanine carboxypeptidase [Oricola sp.]
MLRLPLVALLCFFTVFGGTAGAVQTDAPSMVVEMATGRVLEAERPFARWHPASLTKLMTAYVAFREIESGALTLKSPVRISLEAARKPPSHMAYPVGTIITLDNALKMLLVKSANDIAVAIADSVSGSVEAFAERMNAEARRLGLEDTHFVNPHGLHDPEQYSSARDLAVLASTIRRDYPQYDHYFSTEALKDGETVYDSYNLLLGRFAGADGMKTGYICDAGFNLVGSATREGTTLIAVVLGEMSSKARAEKAADLLEAGFASLGSEGFQPVLASMTPPEDRSLKVENVRNIVCSQEANDARWADRSLDHFATTALAPLTRPLVPDTIFKGGAEGASMSAIMLAGRYIGEVPVPEYRPVRLTDEVAEARRAAGLDLDAKRAIPVPEFRPADSGA